MTAVALTRQQRWYQEHKDEHNARSAVRYALNKVTISEQAKERYRANPEPARVRAAARRKSLRDFVNAYKALPCADCGREFPVVCMDFDHREGKEDNVATMVAEGRPIEVVKKEIAKCDLVCACCHRIRTARRAGKVLA